ncbi:MAG: peptidase MA family metallohydrolase, partial [Myxococcaceae bacterium]
MRRFALPLLLAWFAVSPAMSTPLVGEVKTPHFRIRYTQRATGAAVELSEEIEKMRERFKEVLGRDWPGVTEIRIGVDREEYVALALPGSYPPSWSVALAYPAQNLMLLEARSLNDPANAATVRHELAHVALGQISPAWPRWFQEGMAQRLTGEGSGMSQYSTMFRGMHSSGLMELKDLTESWPDQPSEVELAYAQSASFIAFLLENHGSTAISALMTGVEKGATFEEAFARAFNTSLEKAEGAWRETLPSRYSWLPLI